MGTHDQSAGSWPALDVLVTSLVETRSAIATLQAKESQLLAGAVDLALSRTAEHRAAGRRSVADLPMREVSAELATAMRMSDRAVQVRMGDASTLELRFPATLEAWQEGRVDASHVSAILDAGAVIDDDELRAQFEAIVLDAAAYESAARLRAHARTVAAQIDPEAAAERRRRGKNGRQIRIIDLDDDMARVQADLSATLAYAIGDRLTEMAHVVCEAEARDAQEDGAPSDGSEDDAGVPEEWLHGTGPDACGHVITGPRQGSSPSPGERRLRTMDQVRADVFADLLLAGTPAAHGNGDALAAITAHVQITVPVLTLAGVDDAPALLNGYGPVDAETARRLAAGAPGWDRVMTHPHTGAVLAVDRYRPNADLRRFLAARDERCRFPGCRRPSRRCDIDHTQDAAKGGVTAECNLANFCRRHHTLKHATDWTVRQLGGGVLEWRSPMGRRYHDRPPATVRFVPTDWTGLSGRAGPSEGTGLSTVASGSPPPF